MSTTPLTRGNASVLTEPRNGVPRFHTPLLLEVQAPAEDQADDEKDDEHPEQDSGNTRRRTGDPSEPEGRCDQRQHQEDQNLSKRRYYLPIISDNLLARAYDDEMHGRSSSPGGQPQPTVAGG